MRVRSAAALLVSIGLITGPGIAQVVAPKPEAECQACAAVDLSQRTRFPDRDRPNEEWVLWCEGCRGAYPQWTLQATFACRLPGEREFHVGRSWHCPPEECSEVLEEGWFCLTWDPQTHKQGEVRTSCQCCLGCGACLLFSIPPETDLDPRSITISHGQKVNVTVGGTDLDGDLVAVSVSDPVHGRLAWRSEPRGDGRGMWVDVTYEPRLCRMGRDSFSFVVCDAHGNTASGQVQINVVNRSPTVSDAIVQRTVVADEPNRMRLPAASDPDPGDQETLQYEVDLLPEARSWAVELPVLTVVPYATCFGYVIPYRVRDRCGAAGGGIAVLWVLHRPVVRAPAGPLSVHCGRSTAFSVEVLDQDFLCEAMRTIVGAGERGTPWPGGGPGGARGTRRTWPGRRSG